jgi:hypothetical protein
MRIFTAVRHSNNSDFFYGGLWSGNFYPALRALGHELVESQTDLLPASHFMDIAGGFTREENEVRASITERILDEVSAAHRQTPIELFLGYFYNAHFDAAGFDELRRLGIPSVNFYCNSIHQFDLVAAIAAKADFAWHTEKQARNSYRAIGANPVWVQMAADPSFYRPSENPVRAAAACFIGQRYADRDHWLAALIRGGVPVDIYGPGWGAPARVDEAAQASTVYLGRRRARPGSLRSYVAAAVKTLRRQGLVSGSRRLLRQWRYSRETEALSALLGPHARGAVPPRDQAEVFGRYELGLNFSNVWSDGSPGSELVAHVRLRDFEAPMCRAAYVTGHSDEIAEFYEIGREIETYRSRGELADKVKFYLSHASVAEKLRDAGYRRAIRDHTWVQRFQQLFGLILPALARRS